MTATRPTITPLDPYPPNSDFRIVNFRYVDHLQLVRYNARPKHSAPSSNWQLAEDYTHGVPINGFTALSEWMTLDPDGTLTIKGGYAWDGASGPANDHNFVRASLVHDALYQLLRERKIPEEYREVADDTVIYDGGDGIDSLSLVRLIVSLEERCDEEFGKRLTLADERAMSLRRSPYRTAGALTEFILERLQSDE